MGFALRLQLCFSTMTKAACLALASSFSWLRAERPCFSHIARIFLLHTWHDRGSFVGSLPPPGKPKSKSSASQTHGPPAMAAAMARIGKRMRRVPLAHLADLYWPRWSVNQSRRRPSPGRGIAGIDRWSRQRASTRTHSLLEGKADRAVVGRASLFFLSFNVIVQACRSFILCSRVGASLGSVPDAAASQLAAGPRPAPDHCPAPRRQRG